MFGRRKHARRVSWYRRLRHQPISRDDSGFFSAFLVAKPMLGDLCARSPRGGNASLSDAFSPSDPDNAAGYQSTAAS